MKVFIVEKEKALASQLEKTLVMAGFACEKRMWPAKVAGFSVPVMEEETPGLVILGAGLKEDRKWACCHRIHELEQPFPVLSVVNPARSDEIVAARQAGVDDFICLPVRASELVCRVSVLIRRAYPDEYAGATLSVNDYEFSRFPNRVFFRGREIVLTAKEYELGRLFFEHIGRPVSRLTLAETVWQTRKKAPGRTIDTHVSKVRSKLALKEENGFLLQQVYGYGYRLMIL